MANHYTGCSGPIARPLGIVARVYLTPTEASERTGFAIQTLANWRSLTYTSGQQVGPPFLTVGRRVRYLTEEIDAWMRSQPATNLSVP